MTSNEELIHQFYTSFTKGDYSAMQNAYAEDATFSDAVFCNLNSIEVSAMWQMLLTRSKDLEVVFSKIKEEEEGKVTAYWEARYTFTATHKKVINKVWASFEIEEGKIKKHTDNFNFYQWAKQAFGAGGFLLGFTGFFKAKVQQTAMLKLKSFMQKTNQQ